MESGTNISMDISAKIYFIINSIRYKMVTNESFTENQTVVNGKWYKYIDGYLSRDLLYHKLHPLQDGY